MKHIVLFSGGVASYVAAKRVIEKYGKDDVILLFTDTKTEDVDLYRFLDDAEKVLDISITRLADGRDIWQVFKDRNYLGNSWVDPCSEELKRFQSRKFIQGFDSSNTIVYLGYAWDEIHRLHKAREKWKPYQVEAPLCDRPYLDKQEMFIICERDGIEIPRLYKLGAPHNNCGGGCIKAGIGHFVWLLETMPEVYQQWEEREQEVIKRIGKDVAILTRKNGKKKRPFTLKQLRENREYISELEKRDVGGCGCFDGEDSQEIMGMVFGDLLSL